MVSPRDRLAAAAQSLKPLEQGDLDGLCAIYAVINAIRLAHYPVMLAKREINELFAIGLDELQSRRRLRNSLVTGVPADALFSIASTMLKPAAHFRGLALVLAHPQIRDFDTTYKALRTLRRSMHGGAPVIAAFGGRLDHWTVIARYSRARLTFFDSAGYRWVATKSVGIADDQLPHQIQFDEIGALCRP